MKVLILRPFMDLSFKRPQLDRRSVRAPDTQNIRFWWDRFATVLADRFTERGHNVRILERPMWEFTPALVNHYRPDVVLVPHKQAFQFEGLKCRALYYMQMFCRHLFTVDPKGWGPTASTYPCRYSSGDPESGVYEQLRTRMLDGNESKFSQPPKARFINESRSPYIFFPCQIPHDETLLHHSDFTEEQIVKALVDFANQNGIRVIFKGHPANPASMAKLKELAPDGPYVTWHDDKSVHDLIAGATCVYTINSGVGFEALLHGKPVVTFGRAEYDCVARKAADQALDDGLTAAMRHAWADWVGTNADPRPTGDHRRFIDWYCRQHAIDLTDEPNLASRLDAVVDKAES